MKGNKTAIMQPYFFPYIGYFQLIHEVDIFVLYDNIQYTKSGWINRNNILNNQKSYKISLPLKKQTSFLNINQREISNSFNKKKFLNIINESYKKADNFNRCFSLIEKIISSDETNLFSFLYNSIRTINTYLNIETKIITSSKLKTNPTDRSIDRIISICDQLDTEVYINPIGGISLYKKESFIKNCINLKFLKTHDIVYNQDIKKYISNLSIIDVMMFNKKDEVKELIKKYDII